jgi:hypothetical protein
MPVKPTDGQPENRRLKPGVNSVATVNAAAWMSENLSTLGPKTLRQLCLPGTHDAGMSTFVPGTAFATPCNTLTQTSSILGQLQLGSRYFDIRPVIHGGQFYTGHYTELSIARRNTWQGANGQSMASVISDINAYTQDNPELVILYLSHDLDTDVGNSQYTAFSQEQWDSLLTQMQASINNLKVVLTPDLSVLMLNDFIGNGEPAVIVVVDPSASDIDIGMFATQGFYTASQYAVYNAYSDTNDVNQMTTDQLAKMQARRPSADAPLFLLSWTLTQSTLQAATCGTGLSKSIISLAGQANSVLAEALLPACSANHFPNIIYIDNINAGVNVADIAMILNGDTMTDITLSEVTFPTVDGTRLPALLRYAENSPPTRMIIFCHGHTESMHAFDNYLPQFTDGDTATLAITYRFDDQFPVLTGAEDVIYAAMYMLGRFPSVETVYLYSASMGGAIAGTAIAESQHYTLPGNRRFEYWVSASGVTNLIELYAEAALFDPKAKTQIEQDTGGTPLNKPQEYIRRSPALRATDLKAAGLIQAELIHARNDGMVLYNQALELSGALTACGVNASLNTLNCFSGNGDPGATIYSDVGLPDNVACLLAGCSLSNERVAGHVNTADVNNPSSKAGISILHSLLAENE